MTVQIVFALKPLEMALICEYRIWVSIPSVRLEALLENKTHAAVGYGNIPYA